MKILILTLIGAFILLILSVLLIIAFLKKKKAVLPLLFLVIFNFAFVVWGGIVVVNHSYQKLSNIFDFKPRTGEEIYAALFGKPETDCVKILNYLDQTIPIIDISINLEFTTCPKEAKRILDLHAFVFEKKANTTYPEKGDSLIVFQTKSNSIIGSMSVDSTWIEYKDMEY
jgi:hypothetical protein